MCLTKADFLIISACMGVPNGALKERAAEENVKNTGILKIKQGELCHG
jgi:hypothetical protein